MYTLVERGVPHTLNYAAYFKCSKSGQLISAFHDIPLVANTATADKARVLNMVVEIPRWSNAKMEVQRNQPLNPIRQDVKKGQLRFVDNCFPYHGYIWNYGALPQTWEDPSVVDPDTGCGGDNDPMDVCEIGHRVHARGAVVQVKVLGCFALVDEGETDWKIMAIDVTDPLADKLHDVADIEQHLPGLLRATYDWFRIYKIPTGKPANNFGFDGRPLPRERAERVIDEMHEQWRRLVHSDLGAKAGVSCANTTLHATQHVVDAQRAQAIVEGASDERAEPVIPKELDRWHFVSA